MTDTNSVPLDHLPLNRAVSNGCPFYVIKKNTLPGVSGYRGDWGYIRRPPHSNHARLPSPPAGATQTQEMIHMPARSTRWPYIRTLAYKRDRGVNAPCHICGGKIDYFAAPSSTPDSYEPDHIVPVSMAPEKELDLNNIAASHMRCNRRRGNGTDGSNEIGMRSRVW